MFAISNIVLQCSEYSQCLAVLKSEEYADPDTVLSLALKYRRQSLSTQQSVPNSRVLDSKNFEKGGYLIESKRVWIQFSTLLLLP